MQVTLAQYGSSVGTRSFRQTACRFLRHGNEIRAIQELRKNTGSTLETTFFQSIKAKDPNADYKAPECRANAKEGKAGCRGGKGGDGGGVVAFLRQGDGHGVGERGHQGKTRDEGNQAFGQASQDRYEVAAAERQNQIAKRVSRTSQPALFMVGMCIRPGADGCRNGGKIGGMASEGRRQQREEAGDGDQFACGWVMTFFSTSL